MRRAVQTIMFGFISYLFKLLLGVSSDIHLPVPGSQLVKTSKKDVPGCSEGAWNLRKTESLARTIYWHEGTGKTLACSLTRYNVATFKKMEI